MQDNRTWGGGIDTTLELAPFDDTDVAWGLNVGLGVEVLASGRAAVDARARWNLLIGELRQMESYGVARTFPAALFRDRTFSQVLCDVNATNNLYVREA